MCETPRSGVVERSPVAVRSLIAIIDDDGSVRVALSSLLRAYGFGAVAFASAEAFLASPARAQTEVIVTDVHMRGLSGPALQQKLKAEGDTTPLIFMTAFARGPVRAHVEAAGAYGYLVKPFDGRDLVACVERALRGEAPPEEAG